MSNNLSVIFYSVHCYVFMTTLRMIFFREEYPHISPFSFHYISQHNNCYENRKSSGDYLASLLDKTLQIELIFSHKRIEFEFLIYLYYDYRKCTSCFWSK